jgi:DNA-binding CsgD family transcriptional regulator
MRSVRTPAAGPRAADVVVRVTAPAVSPGAARTRPIETHDTAIVDETWLGRIAAADGLFVTDERQRIQAWSSAAQRMLGYSPEEVVGELCYRVMMGRAAGGHPVCGPNCPVTRNARRGRGTAAYEVITQARDGSPRCVQSTVLVLEGERRSFRVIHVLREACPAALLPPRPARQAADQEDAAPLVESLTRRELEVLRLTAQGLTLDEIAERLSISAFTARNHNGSVQRKLGARNRLDMVLQGLRRGLV